MPDTTPLTAYQRRRNPKRKRRNTAPKRAPIHPTKVRVCWMDNAWVYRVSLNGQHGIGKFMTIDQDVWLEAARLYGDVWNLTPNSMVNGEPASYRITTNRKEALANADRAWPHGTIVMSRWIANANGPTERVYHRNRDVLDVRRCNLVVLGQSPLARAAQRRPTSH